jgi:RHS repeat-associated protein
VLVGKEYYSTASGLYQLHVDVARGIDQESDVNYSNDSIGGANVLGLASQGTHTATTIAGTIMSPGDGQVDEDTYNLGHIGAGQTVLLGVRMPDQSVLRPIVEIYTVDGSLVSISPNPSSGVARFDVTTAGTYFARVLAFSGEGTNGQYLLDAAVWPTAELQFADLAITNVLPPAAAQSGGTFRFEWTVGNFGTAAPTVSQWDDKIVLSVNDRFGDADDIQLGTFTHSGELLPGQTYTAQTDIRLPELLSDTYHVLVKTDLRNVVFENMFDTNNINESATLLVVSQTPYADLHPATITVTDLAIAGEPLTVNWTADNIGLGSTGNGTPGGSVASWTDRLALSKNTVFGDADDILLGDVEHQGALEPGAAYSGIFTTALPTALSGEYYLFVASDHTNTVYEGTNTASNLLRSAGTISIALAPYADLEVTTVVASESVAIGQPFSVQWRVTNASNAWGATQVTDWYDRVVVSSDDVIGNSDDIVLGSFAHHGSLEKGSSYLDSAMVTIPQAVSGHLKLFVTTDSTNSVYEFNYELNNTSTLIPLSYEVINGQEDSAITLTDEFFISGFNGTEGQSLVAIKITTLPVNGTLKLAGELVSTDQVISLADVQANRLTYQGLPDYFGVDHFAWSGNDGVAFTPNSMYANINLSNVNDAPALEAGVNDSAAVRTYFSHAIMLGDPDPDVYRITVNWGDGTANTIFDTSQHTFNISHFFADNGSYTVNVTADDQQGQANSIESDSFEVTTVNYPPSDISLSNARIAENSLPGTVIGTLDSVDNGWDTHTYQLLDDAGGRFVLVGDQIKVADGAVLDYETAASHTIQVRSTDQGGLSFEKSISVNLTDVAPDLLITQVQTHQGVVDVDAGSSIEVSWTIATQGTEQSSASWYDQIYLDNPDTPWLDRWVGDFQTTAQLPLSDGLERIQTIQIPLDMQGNFRVVVLSDVYNNVVEGSSGEANNTAYGSVLFNVLNTNLQVESVTAPSSGFAGREIEVQWVVNNTGNASTTARTWYDQIYLSADTIIDGADVLLGTVPNASYLDIAEGYTSKAKVTLPTGLEGSYHILVRTDAYQQISEGAGEGDNVTSSAVLDIQPIPLSELSDLAVVSVAAPSQALSGQNMSITYTIDNAGQAAITGNSTVWVERISMSSDDIFDSGDRLLSTVWRDLPADKLPLPEGQSHFVTTQKVMLPVGVEGEFYFFVTVVPVSPVSNVFQSNDIAYDTTSTLVRLTPPPDLEASAILAPSTAIAGHDLTFTYQVNNTGSTTTPNWGWYDSLYLSSDTSLDAGDTKLAEVWHSGALESGSNYSNTVTVRLADGLEGSWYLLSSIDSRNDVFELDNANNVFASDAAITINSQPADLVVTEVSAPTAAQAGNSLRISWTVMNQGVGYSSAEQWTDSVILSHDAVLGNGDDVWIGNFTHTGLLQAGQTYSNSALVSLPGYLSGQYQLFVVTDAYNQVYEAGQEHNNARLLGVGVDGRPGSGIQTQAQPTADLQVASVTAPLSAASGDLLTVSYAVVNAGLGRTSSEWWADSVVLSKDDIFGNADDVNIGSLYHSNSLAPGESYQGSGSFRLPIDLEGDYHVWVCADAWGWVTELNSDSNNQSVAAGTTSISLTPTPDLVMSALQAVDQGVSGQSLQVDWTVHNNGAETSGGWRQVFYLSRDGVLDRTSDIYLGYADSPATLAADADATFSNFFRIPYGISGKYYLFGVVDSNNAIYERGGEGNNSALDTTAVQITPSMPVDLVAGVITVPVNGISGAQASISYTVTNQSEEDLNGQWRDSIYLSTDSVWDVSDPLFSRVEVTGPLTGHSSYTQTATSALPGVIGGDYYVIVRSDIFNQIQETNETNNLNVSLDTTRMDVEVLMLGTSNEASFAIGSAVYYRVDVGAGETLRFNFDRAATQGRTELFVSYDAMPSRSDFDYRYNQADSPDQSLVIANTRGGTYYVMAYNASGATDTYAITADTLQFSITEIGTTAGSNKGQVTVRIEGAELTTHTLAILVASDGAEHEASQIYWKDNTELWATFDLRGLSADTYDVKLQDGARTSILTDGFTVNNGELGHVEYGMETPSALRAGQTGAVRVYYQNTGETDVAAPLLGISGNALLKLPEDAGFGGTGMQLLGINSEGPAGILSPGAQGSFQLFFKPAFSGTGTVSLVVSGLKSDQVIDWNTILDASKPENVSLASWEIVKANLIAELGATTTDYQNNLARNATALDQLEGRTDNIAKLFSLDYQKATDTGALLRPLAPGVLGYSHTFAWEITATRQVDGSVLVGLAGAQEHFILQSDGSYKLDGQGTSTLTETSGAFEFHELNGTRIAFNLDGSFAEMLDSNGQGVLATYNGGRLTQVVASNGDSQSFIYNNASRLIQQTDQAGRIVSFIYDADNQHLVQVTTPEGITQYSYVTDAGAAQHRISSITLPGGTVEYFEYDANGHIIRESLNNDAEAITYGYLGVNEVIVTEANGSTTHLWTNEHGQIAQVEDALGYVSQLRYDGNGNMTGIVHADGTSTGFAYDSSGNPISVQDALGHTVQFNYEAQFGQVVKVTDQLGNPIDYGYDSQGNLNSITYSDSSSESYSYDAKGYLNMAVNRNGESVTYTFDNQGYLTGKSYQDGSSAAYTYDLHGNLTSAVDADSHTSFEYDTADRLIKVTDGEGRWLSYQYDAAGHRTQMADQEGHVTNYSYNDLVHLSRLSDGAGSLIASYSYDEAGHLSRGDNGNGTFTTYGYDTAGQLLHLVNYKADGTVNSSFDYTYDAVGHRTSETTLEGTTSYEYDAIGQLIGAILPIGRSIAYHYDAAGNRTSVEDGSMTTNYSTNTLNEYTAVGSATYSYDADGNLTAKTGNGVTTSYHYDVENHLISVTTPTESWSYQYDALGNRIASVHDGARIEYQLDPTGQTNVAAEYDASGNLIADYTYGLGLESQVDTGGSSWYYDYNAIGSTAGLTGSAGSYVNQYSYLPFGETLSSTEAVANSFEYVGQWGVTDEGNGLDFMRARFYSAGEGRFVQTDPIGINGGINLYEYVSNSPVNLTDQSGLTFGDFLDGIKKRNDALGDMTNPDKMDCAYDQYTKASQQVGDSAPGAAMELWNDFGLKKPGAGTLLKLWKYFKYQQNTENHSTDPCNPPSDPLPPGTEPNDPLIDGRISIIRPSDPNDIVGPRSFGDDHWVSSQNAFPYTIHYENQASATAPAQEVTITQTLDSDLNAGSFRLGDFGWGDIYVDVPEGASFYIDRIDLTATKGYMVDVMAGIDVAKHEAYWSFTTIDPNTGEIPVDPTIGFLPPDSDGSIGQGFVNYIVSANADASTGTVIDAKATIVFTTQEPIDTPAIFNTLDTQAPESHLEAVAGTTVDTAQFLVRWSGSDVGSAIAGYTVYVSDNGGAYSPWLENTTLAEATYAGEPEHTYAFYSVAIDNAGNSEADPVQVDLTIQVSAGAALTDTVPPEIAAVHLPTDGLYATGQSLDFALQFTENMFVDVAGLPPVINFTVGSSDAEAVYQSGSGTDTLIFSHLVAAGEYDADGITLGSALQTNGATLRDVAGNPLVGLGLIAGSTSGILIDNAPALQTSLADQSVTEGQNFSFQIPVDTFADVDAGDTLAYTATLVNGNALPDWLSFDNTTRSFSGTPLHGVGALSVTVTAIDSSLASVSDTFELTVANLNQLTGAVTFWKTGLPITAVTSTLASAPAVAGTQPIEFRNIQTAADGSRTLEIWETSPTAAINSVQLEFALPTGSTAVWQDATGLPAGWSPSADTDKPGQFILGGTGTTALSAGSVNLGTLTLTAPANPKYFELSLTSGQLGNDTIPAFGISSDSMITGTDGLYQHLDMFDGTYALTSTKVSGTVESNAIKANDALAALKIAVGMNPNVDGSAVSPYQYLAADVNHDGQVKAADALNILKMAVKLSSAPEKEWLLVPESVGSESMSRTHVVWPDNPMPVTLDMDQEVHLIGIVKGDVNGSWAA